jgi:hypothetical protein
MTDTSPLPNPLSGLECDIRIGCWHEGCDAEPIWSLANVACPDFDAILENLLLVAIEPGSAFQECRPPPFTAGSRFKMSFLINLWIEVTRSQLLLEQ